MCAKDNLRLHKFASNCKDVLEALPANDHAEDLKGLDLRRDIMSVSYRAQRQTFIPPWDSVYYQLSLQPTWSSITRHISQQTITTSTLSSKRQLGWTSTWRDPTTMGKMANGIASFRETYVSPLSQAQEFRWTNTCRNPQLLRFKRQWHWPNLISAYGQLQRRRSR